MEVDTQILLPSSSIQGLLPGLGQNSSASGMASDPPSVLRAAALSTLKSKRRHPRPAAPLRPVHDDTSLRLDYGQAVETASLVTKSATEPLTSTQNHLETGDRQTREEGEISDTEASSNVAAHQTSRLQAKSAPCHTEEAEQAHPSLVEIESISHVTEDENREIHPPPRTMRRYNHPSTESTRIIIDDDHVRPGLTMTQGQYDQAKDIILDLLGWGVDAEYLVQCNLSREIIYYVFNELNLKIPSNLNIAGLTPYPSTLDYLNNASGTIQASDSSTMPIVNSNPTRIDPDSFAPDVPRMALPNSSDFPVKPPKFSRPKSTRTSSPLPSHQELQPTTATFTPVAPTLSTSHTLPHPSLLVMERQRRQQLLARKAVQASRKSKLLKDEVNSTLNSGSECKDQDMESPGDIPEVSVDDFLNSIGPVLPVANKIVDGASHGDLDQNIQRNLESPSMEVDVQTPESPAPVRLTTPPHSPTSVQSSSASIRCNSDSSTDPAPDSSCSTAIVESVPSFATLTSADFITLKTDNENVSQINGDNNSVTLATSRRGLKRPVAADFVDVDSGSSRVHSGTGYTNGGSSRKKTGSFASVSGIRRCVIDLSDSEDDGVISGLRKDLGNERDHRERLHLGLLSQAVPIQPRVHSGRATPTTPLYSGNIGTMSPAALMEKEEEIRRMRELIARREQNRLKKLALSNRPSRTAKQSGQDDAVDPSLIPPAYDSDRFNMGEKEVDIVMQESNTSELQPTLASAIQPVDHAVSDGITPSIDNSLHNSPDNTITTAEYEVLLKADIPPILRLQAVSDLARDSRIIETGQVHTSLNVGMDISSSASQDSIDQLSTYDSLFERYPLLRSHSRPMFSGAATYESVLGVLLPSLKALKLATVAHLLDPSKRICQFEVPGGGACRAEDCDDFHLNTMMIDPGDNVSAQYVHDRLPEEWRRRFNVRSIGQALANVRDQNVRGGKTAINLEAHVGQALMALSGEILRL